MSSIYYCQCPKGLEAVLQQEIIAVAQKYTWLSKPENLHFETRPGGVQFSSSVDLAYALHLHGRISSRIMQLVKTRIYRHEEDLYIQMKQLEWEAFMSPHHTFRIDVTATKSPLKSLRFATLRLKDALVDRFRERFGVRPSVDTDRPQVRVFVYLHEDEVYFYVDLSGEPLFKRGWRQEKGHAPLKENLAAGILALTGWQPGEILYDPMCGSGTFLVEAAQQCMDIPAGWHRNFGFESLKNFQSDVWQRLKRNANDTLHDESLTPKRQENLQRLAGADVSESMIEITRANLKRAGVDRAIHLAVGDVRTLAPPFSPVEIAGLLSQGLTPKMVSNPPYGERIFISDLTGRAEIEPMINSKLRAANLPQHSEDILSGECEVDGRRYPTPEHAFASMWSKNMKNNMKKWSCFVLTNDMAYQSKLRLRPKVRIPLFNGPIECRLYRFDIE